MTDQQQQQPLIPPSSLASSTCVQLYDLGNEIFRQGGKYEEALVQYEEALKQLRNEYDNHDPQFEQLKLKLISNAALCHLSLRNYHETVHYCNKALLIDHANVKALIRRSKAHEQLGDFICATKDIKVALHIFQSDPTDKYHPVYNPRPVTSVEREAIASLHRLQRLASLDEAAQREDVNSRPTAFITRNQTRRLNFGSVLPSHLLYGEEYTVRLCVTNEFGLWSRDIGAEDSDKNEKSSASGTLCSTRLFVRPSVLCEIVPLNDRTNVNHQILTSISKENVIGESGRVDLTFSILQAETADSESRDSSSCCVMLKFSCDRPLPSGQEVTPVASLPLFLSRRPAASRGTSGSVTVCAEEDEDLRDIMSQCALLGGQSVKMVQLPALLPAATDSFTSTTTSQSACYSHDYECVYALECPGSLGIGGKVWDATYGLMEFFTARPGLLSGRVVIELGSGTGLGDSREMKAVDLPPDLNVSAADSRNRFASYMAVPHTWGEDIEELNAIVRERDCLSLKSSGRRGGVLLVGSDVVYDPAGYQPLAASICSLLLHHNDLHVKALLENCESQPPLMVLAHRQRTPENKRFFEILLADASGLSVEKQCMQWKRTPEDVELFIIRPR